MIHLISKNILGIEPYSLVSSKAWDHVGDRSVYKGDWNESLIEPTPLVRERLREYITSCQNLQWYPPIQNFPLIQKIADYCAIDSSSVMISNGSDSVLDYLAKAFIGKGDEVVLCDPTYDNFRISIEVNGGSIVKVQFDDLFSFSTEAMIAAKTEKTKVVYLVSPSNPMGWTVSEKELRQLLDSFSEQLVIVDEAYGEFLGETYAPLIREYPNLVIVKTFSKAFGLAGFRIGYLVASKEINDQLGKIKNHKEVSTFAQIAAEACLDDLAYMKRYVEAVNLSKEMIKKYLEENPSEFSIKEGNFFLLRTKNVNDFISAAEESGVYVRNMNSKHGLEGYVRISIGDQQATRKMLTCLATLNDFL